jgi:hypothetical protein
LVFCFSVLEEERGSLTHLLPSGLAGGCIFCSILGLGCSWLRQNHKQNKKIFLSTSKAQLGFWSEKLAT